MQDIFREYGLFVMVSLVSATVWVVISHILSWGGSNTALYANEDDSEAMQNQFNMTDIQEPRFVNFYIDDNGKNTANLRNVIGYNSPGTKAVGSGKGTLNANVRTYGNYNGRTENWGFPYNTVYGYTAYTATGGYDNIFNANKTLQIEDYFSQKDIEAYQRDSKSLEYLYLNQKENGDYSLNIHVYRIFTDEEKKAIQSKYSEVTTNQVYSTNLIENKYADGVGALYNSNGNNTILDITKDRLVIRGNGKEAYGLYTKPNPSTLKEEDVYDVSYKYTDTSKNSIAGKTTVSVQNLGGSNTNCNTWVLTVKTNGTTDFTWTRDSSSGVAVITNGNTEYTDYNISTELSKYMWNLADTIRIKFFLSTATSSNLADYNNTLSKMIEAGDQKADITNKAVYLINTTFKYKLVYQYKNNLTGMKAEQAYTITVDSNNS